VLPPPAALPEAADRNFVPTPSAKARGAATSEWVNSGSVITPRKEKHPQPSAVALLTSKAI
jgi:hypothetical protein